MNDLNLLEQQLEGLKQKVLSLRADEKLFLNAQGLDVVIKKAQAGLEIIATNILKTNETLKILKDKKKKAVGSVSSKICKKLDEFLPVGESFLEIDDTVSFGWVYEGTKQEYNSLSGGQKQMFDSAINNILGSNIMIVECAEVDKKHLECFLEDIAENKNQIFINSWFKDFEAPESFDVVNV